MANVQYNHSGIPLIAYGSKGTFISTTGIPDKRPKNLLTPSQYDPNKTLVDKYEIADWGIGNRFPSEADKTISKTSVLNSGLKFIRNFTMGQGIFPVKVKGFDSDGNEQLEMVTDSNINSFAKSRMVRRYMEKALRDYLKYGIAYAQLVPDMGQIRLSGINTVNALYSRLTLANQHDFVEHCIVSNKWPDTPVKGEYDVIKLLDEYDPLADLKRFKIGRKLNQTFIFPIRDSWDNNEYYSAPIWYSSYLAGWLDVAAQIPEFLQKAYENQITWKWHVQIPYAFWDKKFPESEYESTKERNNAMDAYIDEIEENLTGSANANKPIFTFFDVNPSGKVEEQWIIKPLENKLDNAQNLVTSAAANSEILFSLMLNPNVLGAGMPGGTYAGNQGGSNIREAFLVNIANSWIDRQNILDPIETFIRFNGADENIEFRFRNSILTTLDSGAGTKKVLS